MPSNKPEQVGIERNLEQIERERIAEDGIVPGGGGAAQIAAAEVAHHGPGIEGGKRHDQREQEDADGGELGVQRMFAQTDVGLFQRRVSARSRK